jgi:Bacterial Ig domain
MNKFRCSSLSLVFAFLVACAPPSPPPPNNGPAFVINAPLENSSLAGTVFFSVQPTDPSSVSSLEFKAGNQVLAPDPKNKFRAFVNTKDYPAGALKLEASLTGANGGVQTQSVSVQNIPNPPSSGTLGASGVVLSAAEKSGAISSVSIPANAADGASVTFATQTKEKVKTATGIDYDALGVTFLGAQNIGSSKLLAGPLGVTSGGFGPQVQPGQAVVQYSIAPDADGDGKGELIVVNTASVAPNGDVISDPVPRPALRGDSRNRIAPIAGPPGTLLEQDVTGFNPGSVSVRAEWTCAGGFKLIIGTVVTQDPALPTGQIIHLIVPGCLPGVASVTLHDLSSNASVGPLAFAVLPITPAGVPPGTLQQDLLEEAEKIVNNIPNTSPSGANTTEIKTDLQAAKDRLKDKMNDPAAKDDLQDGDDIIQPAPDDFPAVPPGADCLTEESRQSLEKQILYFLEEGGFWNLRGEPALQKYYFNLAVQLSEMLELPTCGKPKPKPKCPPTSGGGGGLTGMGSAPPPGGNGCGRNNPRDNSGRIATREAADLTGRFVIKIFVNNTPTPFSGRTDASGYFFVPFIPQGQPFKAVSIDTKTAQRRVFEGVGPATGEAISMFFNFATNAPEPEKIARWDGGGDGTTWNDARNWLGDVPPLDGDKVIIDIPGNASITYSPANGDTLLQNLECKESLIMTGGSLEISTDSSIDTLELRGGGLKGTGNLTANTLRWVTGMLEGSSNSSFTVNTRLEIQDGLHYLNGRKLINKGAGVWQAGTIYFQNNAVFENALGATLTDNHVGNQNAFSPNGVLGTSHFENAGTWINTPTADTNGNAESYVYIPVKNTGTINLNAGLLWLQAEDGSANLEFDWSGTVNIANAARLQFALGGVGFTGVLNGTGSGLLEVSGGTVTLDAGVNYTVPNTKISGGTLVANSGSSLNLPNLSMTGGTFSGSDAVSVGSLTWASGELAGTGITTVTSSLTMPSGSRSLNGKQLVNKGVATVEGGAIFFQNGSIFTNDTGATFTDSQVGNQNVFSSSGSSVSNKFINNGTFTFAPIADTNGNRDGYSYVFFINTGTLNINTGLLWLQAEDNTANTDLELGGTLNVSTGAKLRLAQGTANLSGTLNTTGTGLLEITGGTFKLATGSSFAAANTQIAGGTLTATSGSSVLFPNLTLSSGTLNGNDNFIVSNFIWASGELGGTGTATVSASMTLQSGSRSLDTRALVNKGTATLQNGTLFFQNGGVFTNDTGATFTDSHVGNQNIFTNSGSGVGNKFINNGTFNFAPVADTNGNRDGYNYVFFTNTGTLNINAGRLWWQAEDNTAATDLELGGTVNIADSAFLRLAQGSANLNGSFAGTGSGTLEVTGSTVNLNSSSYSIPNTNLTSGTFRADGTITTNLVNAGVLEVATGIGTLSINGNYSQTTSGRLNLELATTRSFDQLNVSGNVSLNGVLTLDRLAGFEPALGASFAAITAGNLTGTFSSIQNTFIVTGRVFQAAYGSSNLNLNVVAQ